MAEDFEEHEEVDIEEHDLLENPIIKRMFPDLSVIKQEIMDFDFGVPNTRIDTNLKEKLDTSTGNLNILDGSTQSNVPGVPVNTGIGTNLKVENDTASGNLNILSGSTHRSNVTNCVRTKIILGSKSARTENLKFVLEKEVKIVLQNIKPYLTRTKRFCDLCLILYPDALSLNNHKLNVHTTLQRVPEKDICKSLNKRKRTLSQSAFNSQNRIKQLKTTVNSIDHINRENTVKQKLKENNIEADICDLQTNIATNFHKPCFHCQNLFSNQQDLIDHLYSILYAKKAQVSPEKTEKEMTEDKEIVKINAIVNQNGIISNNIQIEKTRNVIESKSIYSCPICSLYFEEKSFCRSHCMVTHNIKKDIQINALAFNPVCKFCNLKHDNILSYNTHLREIHQNEIVKVLPDGYTVDNIYSKHEKLSQLDNGKPISEIKVFLSKIILYNCSECNINFLTYGTALKHFEHDMFHENWICSICHRNFKDKDAILHQKQHSCSNFFKVVKVFTEVKPRILYKCSMCAIHFGDKTNADHVCKLDQSRSSDSFYCKICNIFIESSIKPNHDDDHKLRNYSPNNFEIIGIESPLLKNFNKEHKKNISASPHNKGNISNKHRNVIKISKSLFAKKHLSYNYCNVCKCNICTVHKTDVHLKSLCVNIVRYICKFCGLMFSNKFINAHERLHINHKNLKLQDFTFYNLHTNEKIKPLIPEFPKCEVCEKHFISKVEVKGHLCDLHDHVICPICNTKFSETAYKIHMPFHSYKKSKSKRIKLNKSYELNLNNDQNETNKNIVSKNYKMRTIYTCKNCDLSITTYDEVIEHCHLHTNLNKVEVNAVVCTVCQLKFANSCFSNHLQSHEDSANIKFSHFSFDVMYFGTDKWIKHIFKSQPKYKVDSLIEDSIYKYETRIKMAVIQEGASNLIIYKCEKCQCIVVPNFIHSHIAICCPNSELSDCTFCDLSFACSITRDNHEKLHATTNITMESYKIVIFNREQDHNTNYNISNLKKCYVVYQCRYCHMLVDIYNYNIHVCFRKNYKKCNVCGLILSEDNFNDHILKHKQIPSFNESNIKVVLLGSRPEESNISQKNNDLIPTFNGIVCDYTFYKCMDCEVCIRDARNTVNHFCLIDAAKARCMKCDLIFDEGKLKGHLKLHDTDPDFTRETILVKPFTNRKHVKTRTPLKQPEVISKIANLYKCHCGLHYMQLSALHEHQSQIKKCTPKSKGIQTCSKCRLNFKSDVLFKHLLEHHGDKNTVYKFKIVES